jgi:hypothetical protein
MKGKVRWKPVGLSAKRWREAAHLRNPLSSGLYSQPPKEPRVRTPRGIGWGQATPPLRRNPKAADGFPKGSENAS